MTPKKRLDSYIQTYLKGAYLVDSGFGRWSVVGNKQQCAAIAKKAVLLGLKVRFITEVTSVEPTDSMEVYY